MSGFPFEWLRKKHKLDAIYQAALQTQELIVSLQDQIQTLNARTTTLEAAVTSLGAKVDAEQVEVAAALELLTADNPDLASAITKLEGVAANLGAIATDVESTVTPPPAP
jgi:uncharacterized protein YlxW (UPF0749 family)